MFAVSEVMTAATRRAPPNGYARAMDEVAEPRLLRAIAVFKLAKSAALATFGVAAWSVAGGEALPHAMHALAASPLLDAHVGARALLDTIAAMPPLRVRELGAVALVYACLFATEGVGLWRGRRWAEWLTVVATASLLPFEVWALVERVDALSIAAIVVNLAILAWLVTLLRRHVPRRARA